MSVEREKADRRITTSVSAAEAEAIERLARAEARSVSSMTRLAVREFLRERSEAPAKHETQAARVPGYSGARG
jgi:hypothetical protein